MEFDVSQPHQHANMFGRQDIERRVRGIMEEGALSHGWIISGPRGSGKATLAYRIARGLLDPQALKTKIDLEVSQASRVFRLISSEAHPDLFVAQRMWDDKKSKYQSEITVETVRKLTSFLNRTASGGGWRVAIVDTADHLNRNAANALLKALEEPPAKTALLLLSAAPGRLIATIRSRCRRIDLPALSDTQIKEFLVAKGVAADDATRIAVFSRGRPGYALELAEGEGANAGVLTQEFLTAVMNHGDVSKIVGALSGKAGDARWEIFKEAIVDALSDAARASAAGNKGEAFANASPQQLVTAWEKASTLIARGDGLNLDRGQLIHSLAYDLRNALRGEAA